jgi:sugar phosphate isomerase/epimerase
MKIGICTSLEKLGKFEAMGFDYIETTVTSLMDMSGAEFREAAKKAHGGRIGVEACNVFFPRSLILVGPSPADRQTLKNYLDTAIARVAEIGAECIVFGSGASRVIPDGFDPAAAHRQLRDAIALAGEIALANGVTIVIEPLNKTETNTLNSVAAGFDMAKEIGHAGVKLLADFYHIRLENEPMSNVVAAGAMLRHTHIARGEGRIYPFSDADDCYADFFRALKAIDYQGRMSIEGRTADEDADAPKSLAYLRGLAAKIFG